MVTTCPAPGRPARLRFLTLALVALPLAACQTVQVVPADVRANDDYRVRHPILLAKAPEKLDIFPGPHGTLDAVARGQIRSFAAADRQFALSPIGIVLPRGNGYGDAEAAALVPAIRRELAAAGALGPIAVRSYPVADGAVVAPIHMAFLRTKAVVASRCGEWPRDLASGSTLDGWDNTNYWNFGCATQANFAAQVDDPRDLVEPRALEPSDVQMRLRAIGKVRDGTDPGTDWKVKNSNLGQAGGN